MVRPSGEGSKEHREEEQIKANFREVFRQNCFHLRHLENERMWFTNIYAIVVAATFAFFSQTGDNSTVSETILLFIGILSGTGMFVTWKLSYEYHYTADKTEKMLREELGVEEDYIFKSWARFAKGRFKWLRRTATSIVIFYLCVIILCIMLWFGFSH